MQQDYYAPTAYELQYWKTTPKPTAHNIKGDEVLDYGDYAHLVPSTYLKGLWSSLQSAEVVEDDGLFQFNHQCIRTLSGGRAWLGGLCQFGGMLLLITGVMFLIGLCIYSIIFSFDSFSSAAEFIKDIFPIVLTFLCAGGGMLLLVRLPSPYSEWIFGKPGPSLELNRQTGIITFWHYGWLTGRLKSKQSYNFMEFIPYLQPLVGPTPTAAGCNIVFIHKDDMSIQFSSVGLANFASIADGLAWWDFLQCYMDVAEPLPDSPTLEICRHLDPTSVKFDKKNARPARYWRDMTEQEYEAAEQSMVQKVQDTFY
ncbi:hypothetical protein [Motilimonas pumila]|uniref:Uncharacterized protein n=1 Tax=Motilimonas pumila TaxID=2303987 RepID=A0A418Y9F8_9GAMM|nr:hypothetical protein [Motilimonas pumila]RJG37256.1 hypothetical protein D1Z90_19915 [Motilimonas pumila]